MNLQQRRGQNDLRLRRSTTSNGRTTMSKTMIATLLAASMLATTGAYAAPKRNHHVGVTSKAAQTYARDLDSAAGPLSSRNDWDSRSVIYRGPTYIGRY